MPRYLVSISILISSDLGCCCSYYNLNFYYVFFTEKIVIFITGLLLLLQLFSSLIGLVHSFLISSYYRKRKMSLKMNRNLRRINKNEDRGKKKQNKMEEELYDFNEWQSLKNC